MKIVIECEKDNQFEIVIRCNKIDDEVRKIISLFEDKQFIIGKLDNRSYQIKIDNIYYFEVNEDRSFIYCKDKVYETNLRLYELEKQLDEQLFVRISKSIILNLNKLDSIRTLLNGRYEAVLINDERLIITRHYVSSFKEKFGM
ncbi:LytTR family DNA-binding domain-containing protein [Thomasclavelia cocleata]|uniref:Putative HTH-type transcriptional regulator n=1 Tax=Thomasclavelia cocleata TaxID=69824 RepID=A0A829ZCJ6_9FIRM|nr:LytTR family DNA-binding domain-containing protein [Thomasclavelia cocleata]MCI9130835.1 LytTR family transcriptional regulator [Thomasclavelia cocleata]MCI9629630.1 LytTR family transcriptional regulator [Thomasclavelia cocleata]GFI41722.1 putative HTH-type transcriptional regulator [Thomasclavelia cocleata]